MTKIILRAYLKIYTLDFALHNLTQNHNRMINNHKNQINLCKHIFFYIVATFQGDWMVPTFKKIAKKTIR